MFIFRAISKIISALLSVIVVLAIVITMGWHKSPVAEPIIRPAKDLYNNAVNLVVGKKKEGVIYGAYVDFKNLVAPFCKRMINNLIDFATMTVPKYILLTLIGVFVLKKTKFISWLT